ncbi:MAG TPA: hypothetical protein VG826_27835 [Pirellulales bacterium]|nr:hypothetical protein [Pirellulales bacterium]
MIWLVTTITWVATLFAAVILVRVATAIASLWRPPAASPPRRDGRWLLGWLVLIPVASAVIHCEAGGFYGFRDPVGGDWEFDGHGWPLTIPREAFTSSRGSSAMEAICWLAIVVDLLAAFCLLVAVRLVLDRGLAAWDGPRRWPTLASEAAGWCVVLGVVLFCERWAARPVTLPGTEVIVYSTLIYESSELRAGVLVGVASITYLSGRGVVRGWQTLKRLRDEGVV